MSVHANMGIVACPEVSRKLCIHFLEVDKSGPTGLFAACVK